MGDWSEEAAQEREREKWESPMTQNRCGSVNPDQADKAEQRIAAKDRKIRELERDWENAERATENWGREQRDRAERAERELDEFLRGKYVPVSHLLRTEQERDEALVARGPNLARIVKRVKAREEAMRSELIEAEPKVERLEKALGTLLDRLDLVDVQGENLDVAFCLEAEKEAESLLSENGGALQNPDNPSAGEGE